MDRVPDTLLDRLREHQQEHVLSWWHELEPPQRRGLVEQLNSLDLPALLDLHGRRHERIVLPEAERIRPLPRSAIGIDLADRRRGEEAFARGEIAFLVVAGGQGSRLGFDQPKGLFPVGPVTAKSLFQVHIEKVLALSRRYGKDIPLLVMTSHATHADTVSFLESHRYFGLAATSVRFFQQGTMPALDFHSGRLLMEAKDRLFLGPNGHGGTLTGLVEHGLLDWLGARGVRTIYYFQVDNPLVRLADYVFVGRHLAAGAQVSSKVIAKRHPTEKLGNLALIDGRCSIIEYSDLPASLATALDPEGRPLLWAGSPAIHLFDLAFLDAMTRTGSHLPWHLARKKVPHLDREGRLVQPDVENALKFERFVFDVLPHAERWTVLETTREEFEPLKNAEGPESPATVRQAMIDLAGRWLEEHGLHVPRDERGHVTVPIEISPLLALEAAELAGKLPRSVMGPTYLH